MAKQRYKVSVERLPRRGLYRYFEGWTISTIGGFDFWGMWLLFIFAVLLLK